MKQPLMGRVILASTIFARTIARSFWVNCAIPNSMTVNRFFALTHSATNSPGQMCSECIDAVSTDPATALAVGPKADVDALPVWWSPLCGPVRST